MNHVKITGTGHFVPKTILTNEEICKFVDTTDEWIVKNTGIKERHICSKWESTSFLGSQAGSMAMSNSSRKPEDIDMVIVATTTPEKLSPSTACIIKDLLGLTNAVAFDISAVCSGFLFGMSIANEYIKAGKYRNILVIGVDAFSNITDWTHRHCIFFGDGAGAVVMSEGYEPGFLGFTLYSDSLDRAGFYCNPGEKFVMNTRSVYDTATRVMPIAIQGVLDQVGMTIDQVDYLVPHQPSVRILTEVANRINLPVEKVMMNMDKYANTVAGTIPILLNETWDKYKKGNILLFAAIGSGWTYGAALYQV
jgi:3-oxoacyl-[acyl-carrier-protein] synthase III